MTLILQIFAGVLLAVLAAVAFFTWRFRRLLNYMARESAALDRIPAQFSGPARLQLIDEVDDVEDPINENAWRDWQALGFNLLGNVAHANCRALLATRLADNLVLVLANFAPDGSGTTDASIATLFAITLDNRLVAVSHCQAESLQSGRVDWRCFAVSVRWGNAAGKSKKMCNLVHSALHLIGELENAEKLQ